MRRSLTAITAVSWITGLVACATVGPTLPSAQKGTATEPAATSIPEGKSLETFSASDEPGTAERTSEAGEENPFTVEAEGGVGGVAEGSATDVPLGVGVGGGTPVVTGDTAAFKEEFIAAREQADWPNAERKLLAILRVAPEDADALYNLAIVQMRQGRVVEAADSALAAFKKKPELVDAGRLLIALLARLGRLDQAVEAVDAAIAARPKDVDVGNLKVELFAARREYLRAIQTARSLLKQDEVNVSVMKSLGRVYYMMGKEKTAEYIFRRALELQQDDPEILYYLALIGEHELKDNSKVLALYAKVIAVKPDFPEALNNIGLIFYQTRNYKQAAERFGEALRYAPGFKEAKLNLANSLRSLNEFEEADKLYSELAEKYPDYADVWFNRGLMYRENEMSGLDREQMLLKAVELLRKYKEISGRSLRADDPVDEYIKEALTEAEQIRQAREEEAKQAREQEAKFKRLKPETEALLAEQKALRKKIVDGMKAWRTAGNVEKVNLFQELLNQFDEEVGVLTEELASALENKLADEMEGLLEEVKSSREELQPRVDEAFSEPPPKVEAPTQETPSDEEAAPLVEALPTGEAPAPVEEPALPEEAPTWEAPVSAEEPSLEEEAPPTWEAPVEEAPSAPLPPLDTESLEELPLEPVE